MRSRNPLARHSLAVESCPPLQILKKKKKVYNHNTNILNDLLDSRLLLTPLHHRSLHQHESPCINLSPSGLQAAWEAMSGCSYLPLPHCSSPLNTLFKFHPPICSSFSFHSQPCQETPAALRMAFPEQGI